MCGSIKAVEDTGYVISFGDDLPVGFVPLAAGEQYKKQQLKHYAAAAAAAHVSVDDASASLVVGEVVECVVETVKKGRTVTVSLDVNAVAKAMVRFRVCCISVEP